MRKRNGVGGAAPVMTEPSNTPPQHTSATIPAIPLVPRSSVPATEGEALLRLNALESAYNRLAESHEQLLGDVAHFRKTGEWPATVIATMTPDPEEPAAPEPEPETPAEPAPEPEAPAEPESAPSETAS